MYEDQVFFYCFSFNGVYEAEFMLSTKFFFLFGGYLNNVTSFAWTPWEPYSLHEYLLDHMVILQ
jgi:hypothetical protein